MHPNTHLISKIIVASFAFSLSHWKKIIEISVLPILLILPFLTILPETLETFKTLAEENTNLKNIQPPQGFLPYALLFFYGYLILSIKMYRLVVLGEQSVSGFSLILKFKQIVKFINLYLLIALATALPIFLFNYIWLYFIVYFLIIPITLNFVNIAIERPSQYKWRLPFSMQTNLFFLQALLPIIIDLLINLLISTADFSNVIYWVVKVIIFYWSLISLSLFYQLITNSETHSKP